MGTTLLQGLSVAVAMSDRSSNPPVVAACPVIALGRVLGYAQGVRPLHEQAGHGGLPPLILPADSRFWDLLESLSQSWGAPKLCRLLPGSPSSRQIPPGGGIVLVEQHVLLRQQTSRKDSTLIQLSAHARSQGATSGPAPVAGAPLWGRPPACSRKEWVLCIVLYVLRLQAQIDTGRAKIGWETSTCQTDLCLLAVFRSK